MEKYNKLLTKFGSLKSCCSRRVPGNALFLSLQRLFHCLDLAKAEEEEVKAWQGLRYLTKFTIKPLNMFGN
jgi:hypothetical protein